MGRAENRNDSMYSVVAMRDPDRIKPTLEAIEKLWPDLRLGQLVWIIAGRDPYNMEDKYIIRLINEKLAVEEVQP